MSDKLPAVLMDVRVTARGVPLEALEGIRDDLQEFLKARAEIWGLRVKRRVVSREDFTHVLQMYFKRELARERAEKQKGVGV